MNPHHVNKSKELDDNNPNKNDRKDPKTVAALVNEGRFSYPYMPAGIYAEIRSLSNLRFQTQEELTRIKNRLARWFSICFPEYEDVYGDLKVVSGRMVLKATPLPEAARMELKILLNDMDVYASRMEELLQRIEEKLKEIPYYVLYEAAISLVGKNAEFRQIYEYYRTRKENPLKKMQSVVAVACKVLGIFFAILTKGVQYNPEKLLCDIRRPQIQAE